MEKDLVNVSGSIERKRNISRQYLKCQTADTKKYRSALKLTLIRYPCQDDICHKKALKLSYDKHILFTLFYLETQNSEGIISDFTALAKRFKPQTN